MALLAFLVLGLRFGKVDVHTRAARLGLRRDRLDHLGRRGILAVDAQVGQQAAAVHPVPLIQQAQVVAVSGGLLVVAVIKHGQPAAQAALDTAFQNRFGHAVQEKVHIRERHRARGKHLRDRKLGAVIRGLVTQLILKRKHPLVQPALERQVFRIAAQQCHGRVAVHIVKPGQQQPVAAVIDFSVVLLRGRLPDVVDHAVLYADILPALQLELLIQQVDITK